MKKYEQLSTRRISAARISRRKVIIGSGAFALGLVGAGIVYRDELGGMLHRLGSPGSPGSASPSPGPDEELPAKPINPIPDTEEVRAYRAFLDQHPVQYLSPNELLRPQFNVLGGIQSGIPPKSLWKNMVATVKVADEVRRRLGVPLCRVTSAYRSPQYNAKCSGASKFSQHLKNCALDLVYVCAPREVYAAADQLRKEGFFKGGIGLYSNFVHIDTRGRNATWGV